MFGRQRAAKSLIDMIDDGVVSCTQFMNHWYSVAGLVT